MESRAVITGLEAVTPIRNNINGFWANARKDVCGIDKITLFDTSGHRIKIAGEVRNFSAEDFIDRKEAKRLGRFAHFALAATEEAMKDAKLDLKDKNIGPNRVGVTVGSGIGEYGTLETRFDVLLTEGPNRVSPFAIPSGIINLVVGNIAIKYGAKGVCESLVTACTTGVSSIGTACGNIRHGCSDIVISDGSEASITRAAIAGFTNLKALNTNNDPKGASISFDKERSGFVMGESAGILVLESLESVQKKGVRVYEEIIGYGATYDAYHITSPGPEGDRAKGAIEAAIEEERINRDEVSYINARGTSAPLNDKFEVLAIKGYFGEKAYDIPVSLTKPMTGHLLGTAEAIESVICVKTLEEEFTPPTIGYKAPDEDYDLDYVVNEDRELELNYVINNALGFGGHNASLLFKKWD